MISPLLPQHLTLGRTYAAVVYQPMLELLRFLERHSFTCYIVSGSGREFLRGVVEALYAIPRDRVIGSTVAYAYELRDGVGTIVQQAELDVIDDGPNKPFQIWGVVGRRPILAAGNSNGDLAMLQYASGASMSATSLAIGAGARSRLANLVAGVVIALGLLLFGRLVGLIAMPALAGLLDRHRLPYAQAQPGRDGLEDRAGAADRHAPDF